MVQEGLIDEELQKEMNNYCVVVSEKSFFGKLWDKVFFKDNDEMRITVVKIIK